MITLKKSFEIQNYLNQLLYNTLNVLANTDNITTTKQNHLRNKSYSEASNEEVIVKKDDLPCSINQLVSFIDIIMNEIASLTVAINNAKTYGGRNFDAMISINKKNRIVLGRYEAMAQLKPSESVIKGTAEKFNDTGEQVRYVYDIEQVTTIDYDRNEIKKKVAELRKEVEETSDIIDKMQLESMVDFDCSFIIGESLEEAVERVILNK